MNGICSFPKLLQDKGERGICCQKNERCASRIVNTGAFGHPRCDKIDNNVIIKFYIFANMVMIFF